MSNMSYCRFQNTLSALRDCYYNGMSDEDYAFGETGSPTGQHMLSKDETHARKALIALCVQIANEFGDQAEEGD